MKVKLISIRKYSWNLEFQNYDGYSFPYWLRLYPYCWECGSIGFNPYREKRKQVNYNCSEFNFDGDTFVGYIHRRQL